MELKLKFVTRQNFNAQSLTLSRWQRTQCQCSGLRQSRSFSVFISGRKHPIGVLIYIKQACLSLLSCSMILLPSSFEDPSSWQQRCARATEQSLSTWPRLSAPLTSETGTQPSFPVLSLFINTPNSFKSSYLSVKTKTFLSIEFPL